MQRKTLIANFIPIQCHNQIHRAGYYREKGDNRLNNIRLKNHNRIEYYNVIIKFTGLGITEKKVKTD